MGTPHDILTAYSQGLISASEAIRRLHLDGARDLLIAMSDAGHALPKPPPHEIRRQVEDALPLLRAALKADGGDRHDTFERRAVSPDGTSADWQADYGGNVGQEPADEDADRSVAGDGGKPF